MWRKLIQLNRDVQRPAPGEEQPRAQIHAESRPSKKQYFRKNPRGSDGQQVEHKPAV